ncbi:MAG: helix-turn-helix domain-containing protein [Pseudomonadales bacterium]|nr:helix-turn-helix domain-containing protein [Pseudomonadales bacterium]
MEYQNKTRVFLETLKKEIKAKAIPYQQLADKLGVSLLTIKRQVNAEDISMSKLMALCEVADIDISDIWRQIEMERPKHTMYTQEQDLAFSKNPHLWRYFETLFFEDLSPKDIEKKYQISPASTHAYLRKLEMLGLIQLSVHGNIRMLVSSPLGFGDGHTLAVDQGLRNVFYDVAEQCFSPGTSAALTIKKDLKLSKELRGQLHLDIYELVSKYANISERYFIPSNQPQLSIITCDYKAQNFIGEAPITDIINNDLP